MAHKGCNFCPPSSLFVRFWEAGRCGDMAYATANESRCRRHGCGQLPVRGRPACIAIVPAFHGLTSLPASVTGKTCTGGLHRWYERGMINSTILRAHHHTARALKKGRGSGQRTIWSSLMTKIHAVCGVLGNPAEFDIHRIRMPISLTRNHCEKTSTRMPSLLTRV